MKRRRSPPPEWFIRQVQEALKGMEADGLVNIVRRDDGQEVVVRTERGEALVGRGQAKIQ